MTLNYTLEPNHSSIKTLVCFPVRNREPKTVGGFFYLACDSRSTQNPDAKVPIPGISEGPRRSSKELQCFKLALAKQQNMYFMCVCVCIYKFPPQRCTDTFSNYRSSAQKGKRLHLDQFLPRNLSEKKICPRGKYWAFTLQMFLLQWQWSKSQPEKPVSNSNQTRYLKDELRKQTLQLL